MRILLDECVNPRVCAAFPGHHVRTVLEMGWGGITNGKLMALAQSLFDVFIVVVRVPDNKVTSYRPLFAELLRIAEIIGLGEVIQISNPER